MSLLPVMSRTLADILLLIASIIWGVAFVFQKQGMEHLGPLTFTGIRFLMGALVVLPFAFRAGAFDRCAVNGYWPGLLATGLFLFTGATLQQIGVGLTSVTNSGFLTSLYVPLVPIIAWLAFRRLPHPIVWPAAAGCVVGTFLLSGAHTVSISTGDLWIIASTAIWAGHVIIVGEMATRTGQPLLVALTQFVICGVLGLAIGLTTEPVSWAGLQQALPALAYAGFVSVGIGYTLQVVGQRWTTASDAALILSSEAVFAALAGALMLNERLSPIEAAGCTLILGCILIVQLMPARHSVKAENI